MAHFTGSAETDSFHFVQSTWRAAGRTADAGGSNIMVLAFAGTVSDGDFKSISHIHESDLAGSGLVATVLSSDASAAFGNNTVKVTAVDSATLRIDGHALHNGWIGTGGGGNDSFIGGAVNDSFQGSRSSSLLARCPLANRSSAVAI